MKGPNARYEKEQKGPVSGRPPIKPGEPPLIAFVSSVMCPELDEVRQETVHTLNRVPWLTSWAFEYTPASSEPVDEGYLRKVREADVVIWLVGEKTTKPVQKEIREALASNRRLWVMKLPAEQQDEVTKTLLQEVKPQAKWIDTTAAGGLRQALDLTLGDEIVWAMRGKRGLGRLARLEEIGRASRARCIMRWQAAGVPWAEASNLADNLSVGALRSELQPHAEKPILLLIGEIGVGKSLTAERLLQDAVMRARDNANTPVPVYLDARSAVERLREAVEAAASGLGNPQIQGAAIIIDGADEVGTGLAAELLNEARVLVGTWPKTKTVITSRPIPNLTEAEEAVQVPQLSEAEAYALIGRFSGHPVTASTAWSWPKSVQDAVRCPLFAVLLGIYLREQDMRAPRSTGELLSSLVERALSRVKVNLTNANWLLQRLASLSTDRNGGPVSAAEVASKAELQQLLNSGLVVERSGALAFPLPILTQWFAAQSLAAGVPKAEVLISDSQRLEHWRYPFIIFAGTFNHDQVSKLLAPLAERHPALAAEIVNEGLARWGLVEDVPPPPPLECGKRVRTAMQAWTSGIGPLAQLIAPVRKDGTLLSVGAHTSGVWLTTAWYRGDDDLAKVVELPSDVHVFGSLSTNWTRLRRARPGRQPAWAWRWALDELVSSLSNLLQHRALPVSKGPLAREAVWQAALAVTGRGSLHPGPIPLAEIEERLSRLPEDAGPVGTGGRRYDLNQFRAEVNRLHGAGETELCSPWPGPDRDFSGGWIWSPYTDKQILTRAKAVYAGALEGYQRLVDMWLQKFTHRLQTAATLPARFVGIVAPPQPDKGIQVGPVIKWYLEALPHGSKTTVDLHLGEHLHYPDSDILQTSFDRVRSLRPEAAEWIGVTLHKEGLDIFRPNSATELAYDWLWNDLEQVSWVKGLLGNLR